MTWRDYRLPGWLRWSAVALVAGFIFYASVLDAPASTLAPLGPFGLVGVDKWLHALGYGALAFALAVALAPDRTPAAAAALAALLALAYGIGIEFVQVPLPARHFSVADMLADGIGACVAVAAWRATAGLVGRTPDHRRAEA